MVERMAGSERPYGVKDTSRAGHHSYAHVRLPKPYREAVIFAPVMEQVSRNDGVAGCARAFRAEG